MTVEAAIGADAGTLVGDVQNPLGVAVIIAPDAPFDVVLEALYDRPFYRRCMGPNPRPFIDAFVDRFDDRRAELAESEVETGCLSTYASRPLCSVVQS